MHAAATAPTPACCSELSNLSLYIDSHWAKLQESMRQRGRPPPADLRTILHDEAPMAVQATIDEMCTFIGAKSKACTRTCR